VCGKAKLACLCPWITTIDTNIELCILQHTSEVKRAIGTARILSLSLPNSKLFVGENFSDHAGLNSILQDPNRHCALLYPNDTAITISDWSVTQSHTQINTIILLDGTWKKAFKIWQLSENLQALPSIRLDDGLIGQYRIRKSPKSDGLSTVEAGFHVLSALTNTPEVFQPLLTAFDQLIQFQIDQMPKGVFEKHYGKNKSR
jgi:DTW domain-containing protein YfiP